MQIGASVVLLDELEHLRQQLGLVDERDAGVDVEHVGARRDLRLGVDDHRREVARAQLLGELLAPGRVDPLADDAERLLGADDDGLGPPLQNRVHAVSLSLGGDGAAALLEQLLGLLDGGRGVGRVAVGADGVGVLLRDRARRRP